MLIKRIISSLVRFSLDVISPNLTFFESKEEYEKRIVKQLRLLLKKAKKTYFYTKIMPLPEPEEINSVDDISKLPVITRDHVVKYGHLMLPLKEKKVIKTYKKIYGEEATLDEIISKVDRNDPNFEKIFGLEKYIHLKTSGTSTGEPVIVYFSKKDAILRLKSVLENFANMVDNQYYENIVVLFPKESSSWNLEPVLRLVYPNLRYMDYNDLDEDKVRHILEDCILLYSYTHIPRQVFTKYKYVVDDVIKKDKLKLRVIALGGSKVTESNINALKSLLKGIKVVSPLMSIECLGSTYICPEGNNHASPLFYSELDENGQLLFTFLYPDKFILPRYATGDVLEKISCPCNHVTPAYLFISRLSDKEAHKHFTIDDLEEILYNMKSADKISLDSMLIHIYEAEYGEDEGKQIFDIYVKKTDKYNGEDLTKEFIESLRNSKVYGLKIYSGEYEGAQFSSWKVRVIPVSELPINVMSGKAKFYYKQEKLTDYTLVRP